MTHGRYARGVALALTACVASTPRAAAAQQSEEPVPQAAPSGEWTADMVSVDPFAAPAPFGPGEHLVYKVKVGIINAGYGFMTVHGTEDIRDNPSYAVEMGIQGGIGPLKVNDSYRSWFDVTTFQSWRFIRDIHEVSYKSYRHYEMFPERMEWAREDIEESGPLLSALPMDEITFIYFIRSLPLEVGKSYTFNRYFKEDGNPVVVQVLRKDQREVEGVLYNTIVVKPLIRSSGLFSEGGDAELHFTDDERKVLVYMKSNIPKFPGSLTLHLQTIHEGFPLNPQSRTRALAAREARERAGGAAPGR
jgi:hypothetical protein